MDIFVKFSMLLLSEFNAIQDTYERNYTTLQFNYYRIQLVPILVC